jgi:hypothetical protein
MIDRAIPLGDIDAIDESPSSGSSSTWLAIVQNGLFTPAAARLCTVPWSPSASLLVRVWDLAARSGPPEAPMKGFPRSHDQQADVS